MKRLVRWLLGGLFLAASLDKIQHPALFAEAIAAYRLVPPALVTLFALLLPWLEFYAGVGLLIGGLLAQAGAAVVAALSIGFSVGVGQALLRGLEIQCGCSSWGGGVVSFAHLALDLLLLAAAVFVISPAATTDEQDT